MKRLIFFDADDTLWENEEHFRNAERQFAALFNKADESEAVKRMLWRRQEENIPVFGYGSKTYLTGMVETAFDLCGGVLDREHYNGIKDIILNLAGHKLEINDGVEETLARISSMGWQMAVATKGDITEQMNKCRKSGLGRYFHHFEVLENKDEKNYMELCRKNDIAPEELVMVGNSVKSDITPVVEIGGRAILVPHEVTWDHEFAQMPVSDRAFEVRKITEIPEILEKF